MAANITSLGIVIKLDDLASANTDKLSEAMGALMQVTNDLRTAGVDVIFDQIAQSSSDLANSLATDYAQGLGGIAPLAEIATQAIDDQAEATSELTDRVEVLAERGQEAGSSWDNSFWGKLAEFGSGDSLKSLKTNVGGLISVISSMSDAMMDFGESGYGADALEYEDATQKMSAALGRGGQGAQRFRDEISAGTMRTQFAVGEYLQLAGGLSEVGVAFSDLSIGAQDDFIALNQVFDVSGQQIGMMSQLMPQMGGDTRALLNDVTNLSAAVGVDARGAFQALPGVVEQARMSTGQFGEAITGSGDKIVKSVVGTGAVFSKVFGKDMAQAMSEAQQSFDSFTSELNTFSNVFTGMDSDFGPFSKALMETGQNIYDIQGIMKSGQKDPVAFAESIRGISNSLGEGSVRQKRFMEQLRRSNLDANLMTLIRDEGAFAKAVEERAKVQAAANSPTVKASKAFGELSKSMLDSTLEFKSMFSNVKESLMTTLHTAGVVTILKDAFAGAKDTLASFSGAIVKFIRSDQFKGWVETVKPFLVPIGKGILLLGTAFAAIGSAAAGIATAIGSVFALGAGLKMASGPALKLGGIVGSSLLAPFKLLAPSVTATGKAFTNVGGGFKAFLGKAGGVTKWIGSLFARIPKLGGLLTGLVSGFKGLGGMLLKGLGGAGAGIGGLLGNFGGKIMGFIGPLVAKVAQKVPELLAKFGPKLLSAIPGIGQIIAVIKGVKTALMDMGEVMGDPNATGAEKFQALLRGVFKGVMSALDGMLLGIPSMILKKFFPDMERKFDRGFAGLFNKISSYFGGGGLMKTLGGWWTSATTWLGTKLSGFATWFEQQMPNIKEFGRVIGGAIGGLAKFAWDSTISAFKGIWNATKSAFNGIWDMIASVFKSEEGAKKVEDAGSGIGESLKSIGISALQGMGEAMSGAFNGILEAFGTSSEELKLKAELAWIAIKNGFSETWDNMKLGVRQKVMVLGNLMMIGVNEFLIDPLNKAFSGIAKFFPDMMAGMV
ncbi:MAG TPA: hypothetical protein VFI02_17295, partial [Armatimonadota bacterium]|nr:hypothetical protein [Armatimonadota bacterium]